jgi:hypothetical protein
MGAEGFKIDPPGGNDPPGDGGDDGRGDRDGEGVKLVMFTISLGGPGERRCMFASQALLPVSVAQAVERDDATLLRVVEDIVGQCRAQMAAGFKPGL